MPTAEQEKVWRLIDRDALVRLATDLVNIPSPTGEEKEIAAFYRDTLKGLGMKAFLQEIEADRYNAIGTLEGDGSGTTLMFNGHMDTSYSGKERGLPDLPAYQPKAWVDDGWVYGLGIYNMKAGLACFVASLRAVLKAGIPLRGDVIIAGAAGEIEMGPVDNFQGRHYRGAGCGSCYMATHGVTADMAIVGEPTALNLVIGHMGYVYSKITTRGMPAHSVYADPGDNAILKMNRILSAIEAWAPEYGDNHKYRGRRAAVNIAAVDGGWAYRCSRAPVFCTAYLDVRLLPGQHPLDVKREIAALLRRVEEQHPQVKAELELFMSNPGSEIDPEHPVFQAVQRAHKSVFGRDVVVTPEGWFSDATHLSRYNIPTLNYGPSGRTKSGKPGWDPMVGEHVSIDDMVNASKVYASIILDLCTRHRRDVLGH